MAKPLRVLAVHGVGGQDGKASSWEPEWARDLTEGIGQWTDRTIQVAFLAYDDIFSARPLSAADVTEALVKLAWNGLASVGSDLVGRSRGLLDVPDVIRWTAGMAVQWIEDDALRAATRRRVLEQFTEGKSWDVVAAHSLGSLICYDAFQSVDGRNVPKDSIFLTFGSQLGNAFVRGAFGGRIDPIGAAFWYHLFNPHDLVFTHSLDIFGGRFRQILLDISVPGLLAEHDATTYLTAPDVVTSVFHDIAQAAGAAPPSRSFAAVARSPLGAPSPQRALLIGINDYPDPANHLDGCLNDVYVVSAVLQELGWSATDMRVLLNDRATTANIKDRIGWLLEGTEDGHQRLLFYSGHGAQIPDYNAAEEVDHQDECLVPYDFDWTPDHAITDKWFASLYAQLPYQSQFTVIMDCCHAGGMTRAGAARVRGLTPPDDIRHRILEWKHERWVPRTLKPWNQDRCLPRRLGKRAPSPSTRRLGRASDLRTLALEGRHVDAVRRDFGNNGPYMPMLFEACREEELAYEYRQGASSYGAFTYFLALAIRSRAQKQQTLTGQSVCDDASNHVKELYPQRPQLECPDARREEPILAPSDGVAPAPRSLVRHTKRVRGRRRTSRS